MAGARRVLVIAAAPFRDAALLVGPLATRRAVFRGEHVTVAAPAGVCEVVGALGLADEVWETPEEGWAPRSAAGAVRAASVLMKAQRGRFDAVFDLFPGAATMAAAWLASGGRSIHASPGYGDVVFRSRAASAAAAGDPVERIAGVLGVAALAGASAFAPAREADDWFERALGATGYEGGPVVVVHTSGLWPRHGFAEVAGRLRSALGAWIVALDAPRGARNAPQIAEAIGGSVLALAAPPGPRFVAALARASLVVTDDAGVAALATFVGVRAVLVTRSGEPALPTLTDRFVLAASEPERIAPDAVFDAASMLLGRSRTSSLFR